MVQEAGLEAMIAAARAASSVQQTIQAGLTHPVSTDVRRCANTAGLDQRTGATAVEAVEPSTLACIDRPADDVQAVPMPGSSHQQSTFLQLPALGDCSLPPDMSLAESGGSQPCAVQTFAGLNPEHMLYWVSQAEVAQQLRCIPSDMPGNGIALNPPALAQQDRN